MFPAYDPITFRRISTDLFSEQPGALFAEIKSFRTFEVLQQIIYYIGIHFTP